MMKVIPCGNPATAHAKAVFQRFRSQIGRGLAANRLATSIIGKDVVVEGPLGQQALLYTDYAASGRALREVEDFVLENVLPVYANPHTQASHCGRSINALRGAARAEVGRFCGAKAEDAVIFAGSGATAGIQKLVKLIGADQPDVHGRAALVLLGPYEHHSNLLPWRESGAEVIELPEDASGGPDLASLTHSLQAARGRRIIGAFSAGSNVTGALSDVVAVSRLVQSAGGKVVWDYAGAAPYLAMNMHPAEDVHLDALVFSPHKFLGGPASSGVLVMRREAALLDKPSAPGGGTVSFVSLTGQDYLADLIAREEAGTPNAVGDIRTALAMIVRDCIMEAGLDERAQSMCAAALARWRDHPNIEVLGRTMDQQLPLISFRIRDSEGQLVHHQLVTRILSDCFGIQARGGCACAGPYVHRLLAIDDRQSQAIQQAISSGKELEKPGFVRVNFSPLLSDEDFDRLVTCIEEVAQNSTSLSRHFIANETMGIFEPVSSRLSA